MLECPIIVRVASHAAAPYMSLRLSTLALLALVGSLATQNASALGFGRVQSSAVLGQTLEVGIAVRLDADESLSVECVSAEVALGDARLPRTSVSVTLDSSGPAPVIRVRTLERVDEPVVTLTVSAGCGARVARQFTLFPDPPGIGPAAPPVAEAANLSVASAASPAGQAPAADASAPAQPARPAPAAAAAPAAQTGAPASTAQRPTPAARQAETASPPVSPPVAAPKPSAEAAPAPRPRPKPPVAAASAAGPRPVAKAAPDAPTKPRLKLDAPSMSAAAAAAAASAAQREIALKAAEDAASAARGAAAEAANRVAAMEKGIATLQAEAKANREAMERLNRQLAESQSRAEWMPVLAVGVVALLAVAGVLAWRLRKRQEDRDEWWSSQQAGPRTMLPGEADDKAGGDESVFPVSIAPDSVMPEPDQRPSAATSAPAPVVEPRVSPVAAAAASPVPARPASSSQATQVLPPGSVAAATPVRDMSMEELLDLEQQAEFFTVLGQDDAAIDLLLEHLRGTGGTVPLPYLKLMEIYRRVGDRDAHERMRERFNQRFNAVVPAWEADIGAGRTLEDYPTVIQRLQRDWSRPVDSMATLETLLFRADGGQVFDLPAYRDVLFLYGMAHDLIGDSGDKSSRIDVMLPLGDDTPAAPTDDLAFTDNLELEIRVEDQVTLPLPLDLPLPGDPTPGKPRGG